MAGANFELSRTQSKGFDGPFTSEGGIPRVRRTRAAGLLPLHAPFPYAAPDHTKDRRPFAYSRLALRPRARPGPAGARVRRAALRARIVARPCAGDRHRRRARAE